ncbi:hypothetical protein RHMOL_Rhmol01G0020700 [Rhododendron molle]|uniref:Uncharacterized protein n=1 Tax=Rhododendron molle TaxID=49168 RepID=A0ACC0PZ13_RHOML|nr:hypothetical protein RHMOL_Rhmol01G0020700 [Rhododendron molle]
MEQAGVITRSKTQPDRPATSMVSQASQSPSETRGKKQQSPKQKKIAKKCQRLTQESESELDSPIQTQKQTRRKKQQSPKQTKNAAKQESKSEPEPHSPTQTQKQYTFRSNVIGTVGLLSKLNLNNAHLDLLKQTPFWMLIDAIRKGKLVEKACIKHDKPILSIIETYDTNDSKFLIGGKKIAITRNDIKLIFGITCGNKPIGDLNKKKSDVAFATRRGIQEARISSKKMKDMINKILQKKEKSMTDEDIKDVVRLVYMFICLTLFFSTSGVTIAWTYVHCMKKIEETKDYDWAQSIAETLNTSMHKFHDKPRDATGCVVALMGVIKEHRQMGKFCDSLLEDNDQVIIKDLHQQVQYLQNQKEILEQQNHGLQKDKDAMKNQLEEMEKERDELKEKLHKMVTMSNAMLQTQEQHKFLIEKTAVLEKDIDGMKNQNFLGRDQDSANRALDAVRSKILNTRTILIPIYSSNHYTLLELDTIDQEWRFYNSIRREGRRDKYCEATANLRKNVTNYINLHCKKKIKPSAKLLDNAPQQKPGSDPKRSWTLEIYYNRMKNLRLQKYYDDQELLEEKKKQA